MRAKGKHISEPRDRRGPGVGGERPALNRWRPLAKNDLIDFIEREARNLNRGLHQDELFELEFQCIEVPLALFGRAIDGEFEHTLFIRR